MQVIETDNGPMWATDDGVLIVDDYDGSPVPDYVCIICEARSDNECCCGAWDRKYASD